MTLHLLWHLRQLLKKTMRIKMVPTPVTETATNVPRELQALEKLFFLKFPAHLLAFTDKNPKIRGDGLIQGP